MFFRKKSVKNRSFGTRNLNCSHFLGGASTKGGTGVVKEEGASC